MENLINILEKLSKATEKYENAKLRVLVLSLELVGLKEMEKI